jgi:hypothetical protein
MKRITSIILLALLMTMMGHEKTESKPHKNSGKNKSSYVVLTIEGREYGKFGIKDDVPFATDSSGKTAANISLGTDGFSIYLIGGDVTATRGTILYLFLKNASGPGKYSFDGLTISGFDGSGTNLNYRTGVGDNNFFFYNTDEQINRTRQGGASCVSKGSGILGKTEVEVTKFTRNSSNPNGLIEGNFTAKLNGNSVKDKDDCGSDRQLTITGYFYVNN